MTAPASAEHRFWALAAPLLDQAGVTRSTMMGLPCLRIDGAFFASWDHRSGALLVKLPAHTVDQLIADRRAEPFAPAGRRFREWAAIPAAQAHRWPDHLDHALAHVAALPPPKPKPKGPR